MTESQTRIELAVTGENGEYPLFKGIIEKIEVKAVRDIYYMTVEAVSNTYCIDQKIKNRSFQNGNMSYYDLIRQVTEAFPGADFQDNITRGEKTGKYIMQYRETDWAFLKRMASRFNTGLIPDHSSDKPKFHFGLPKASAPVTMDSIHYSVYKNLNEFRNSSENYISSVSEGDFIYYVVESDEIIEVGSEVNFNNKNLLVCQIRTYRDGGVIKHRYTLAPRNGLSQNNIYNMGIVGVSLLGRVIDVIQDKVRVHLEIDQTQDRDEAYWFPYATVYTAEGNSGWYCMPELDDYVLIYFPGYKEEEGIALMSSRQNSEEGGNNKTGNPDVRYFRTKSGKELMFSPEEILITGKDNEVFLRIHETKGIELYSKYPINIISEEDITMESQKKIMLSAADEINVNCNSSFIQMNGVIDIKGKKVKTN
jgi:hypothetical protein